MSLPKCKQECNNEELSILEKSSDYICLLAFLEKFSVPLGLYEYSLKSLETGLLSSNEVFVSLGMQELHFQLMKRIQVGRSITRSRVVKFLWKFASRQGLDLVVNALNQDGHYESLSTELRLKLLKALIDCQLDENIRFRHFVNEQPSECVRSYPNGKDRHGIGYWFFEDSELSVRLFTENLMEEERPIELIAKDVDALERVIDKLLIDPVMIRKFEDWLPLELPEKSVVRLLLQTIVLKVHLMNEAKTEELKRKPPENKKLAKKPPAKKSRRRRTRRRASQKALRKNIEENDSSESTFTDDDEDFLPVYCGRYNSEDSADCELLTSDLETVCRKCNLAQAESIVLLCDGCNDPYHPDCLVPPMVDIPDGDWYCPLCDQKRLCEFLCSKFTALVNALNEREQKRVESAIKRQNRLASVKANLDNLLKHTRINAKMSEKPKHRYSSHVSNDGGSSCSDGSPMRNEDNLGIRKCRIRCSVNYRFDDYEAALKAAIGESDTEASSIKSDNKRNSHRRKATDEDEDFEINSLSSARTPSSLHSDSSENINGLSDSDELWSKPRSSRKSKRGRKTNLEASGWRTIDKGGQTLRRSTRQSVLNRKSYKFETGLTSSEEKSDDEIRPKARPIESSSSSPGENDEKSNDLMWQRRLELNQFTHRQASKSNAKLTVFRRIAPRPSNEKLKPDQVILNPLVPPPFVRPYPLSATDNFIGARLQNRSSLTRGLLQQPTPLVSSLMPRAIRTISPVVSMSLQEDSKITDDDDAFMIKNILKANLAEDDSEYVLREDGCTAPQSQGFF